jgi:DNA-binding transcriptional LysR family regulator
MKTGAMTRAASLMGISQPAVTSLIRNLERELGFVLFERQKGRLLPTPEAEHLYAEVQETLGGFQRISEVARQIREKDFGTIVIATYPGIAIDFLPMLASEFLAERPNVRFRVLSRSSYVVRDMIPFSQFDIGVLEGPLDQQRAGSERLEFECCCVLSERHPLACHDVLTPQLLDGVPFVSLYREHMTYGQIASSFKAAGSHWNVVAETQYFATCCAFAAHGPCVSIAHPVTAHFYRNRGVAIRKFRPAIVYEL